MGPVASTDRRRAEAVAVARESSAMHESAVATEAGFRNHFPAQQQGNSSKRGHFLEQTFKTGALFYHGDIIVLSCDIKIEKDFFSIS